MLLESEEFMEGEREQEETATASRPAEQAKDVRENGREERERRGVA